MKKQTLLLLALLLIGSPARLFAQNASPLCGFSRLYPQGNGFVGFYATQLGNEYQVIGAQPLLPTGTRFLSIVAEAAGTATGSSEDDVPAPMSQAPLRLRDGYYLFLSTTIDHTIKLEKRPAGGSPIWSMIYAVPDAEVVSLANVIEALNGDLFVTGIVDNTPASAFYQLFTLKTDAAGTQQWLTTHTLQSAPVGFFGRATDGGYLLAGSINNQLWLLKTDHVGGHCDSMPAPPVYCPSQGDFPWHDWIGRVQLGLLDHASGKSPYSDFSDQQVVLQKGQSYVITLTAGYSWETFDEYWRAWIDYNHDGVFSTPDELVQQRLLTAPPNGTAAASVTGSANISLGALTGPTRLRVSMRRGAFPSGCDSFAFGEVEDYTVVLTESLISDRLATAALNDLTLFPNPAAGRVTLLFKQIPAGPLTVRIIDLQGRTLKSHSLPEPVAGTIVLGLEGLPAGYYFMRVEGVENRGMVQRLVIVDP